MRIAMVEPSKKSAVIFAGEGEIKRIRKSYDATGVMSKWRA